MSVVRINKNRNYTVMSNYHLRDKNMSLKAIGLLSKMLSLPDDWDYSISGLVSICKENETAIKNTLKELEKFGYLRVTKLNPDKTQNRARFEYIYDIFEYPIETEKGQKQDEQDDKKQGVENLHLENLQLEKQGQLNTKELNTKELNTNNNINNEHFEKIENAQDSYSSGTEENKESSFKEKEQSQLNQYNTKSKKSQVKHRYGEYSNVLLSDSEYEKLKEEFPNDYQERIDKLSEYIASTGKKYKNFLATIRSWAKRDKSNAKVPDKYSVNKDYSGGWD